MIFFEILPIAFYFSIWVNWWFYLDGLSWIVCLSIKNPIVLAPKLAPITTMKMRSVKYIGKDLIIRIGPHTKIIKIFITNINVGNWRTDIFVNIRARNKNKAALIISQAIFVWIKFKIVRSNMSSPSRSLRIG